LALFVWVTLTVAVLHSDELADLRGQIVAALAGVTNWYLIATDGSYFEQLGRPPLLRHLWSLAVELQFYLLFPPLFVLALRRTGARMDRLVMGLGAAIVASTVYMAVLYDPGTDPTRAYFDTFARLAAPLTGAVLALLWRPASLARGPAANAGARVSAAGIGGLVVVLWFMHAADDRGALMYRGGFLVVALASAVVVAAAVHPGAVFGRVLAHPVLVAIGLRSYGLYLWHWPVFMLLRPRIDVSWSWGVTFVVRIVITVVLTELCYRYVERPWHLRAPDASFAGIRRRLFQPSGIPTGPRLAALGGTLLTVVSVVILALPHPANDDIAESLEAGQAALEQASRAPAQTPVTSLAPGQTTTTTTAPDGGRLLPDDGRVTMVGDSVMLGAAPDLLAAFGDDGLVDAAVARQADELAPTITQLGKEGRLGSTVVVQVGINGTVSDEDLRSIAEAAAGRRLVVINARVPRPWEQNNNAVVADVVPTLDHASVLDWYRLSDGQRQWYLDDGVHLTTEGRAAYADAIVESVAAARER
jgi:peptidoglycan/LPS O-acetylase OafA/YrhL